MQLYRASLEEAQHFILNGKKPYQFVIKNPHAKILGPAYDASEEALQQAKERGFYAETLEEAQKIATAHNDEVIEVAFYTKDIQIV